MRQGAFWHRLDELALLPDMHKHRVGIRQLGTRGETWSPESTRIIWQSDEGQGHRSTRAGAGGAVGPESVPEAERQTRWQQLWQCLNLLLPLRPTWAGAVDMPGLEALQNAPGAADAAQRPACAWVEALSLVLREMHAWAHGAGRAGAAPAGRGL
jgi:DEAD/DEAH box helicase domain-containing protein